MTEIKKKMVKCNNHQVKCKDNEVVQLIFIKKFKNVLIINGYDFKEKMYFEMISETVNKDFCVSIAKDW